MGPRAGLEGCRKTPPAGIPSPDRPARNQSPFRLRYPGPITHVVQYLNLRGCLSSKLSFHSYKLIRLFFYSAAAQRAPEPPLS
jgi:hypothetical protein